MNDTIEIGEGDVLDVSIYIEIIYMYRCRICGVTDSSMRAISFHVLSDHAKKMPPELITTEDVGEKDSSMALPISVVCSDSEPEDSIEDREVFVSVARSEGNSNVVHCTKSNMGDKEPISDHCEVTKASDIHLGQTQSAINKKSVSKTANSKIVNSVKRNTKFVESSQSGFELKSPGLITSRSVNVNTMSGVIKRPRGRPRGKSSRSFKDDNCIGDCTNVKKQLVENCPKKNSEVIIQNLVCSVEYCSARFSTEENLDYHRKCHNDSSSNTSTTGPSLLERMSRCPECRELFPAWKTLQLHLWAQHEIDVELLRCSECVFRTDAAQKLHAHQATHSTERPHCCRVCGLGFTCNVECLTHADDHKRYVGEGGEGNARGSILCDTCGSQFVNQHVLKAHIEDVHDKRKPFICSVCGHPSARKAMMLAHLRTHTGEKPYRCDMCNYSAGDHNTLRRHKMRHTGKTSYKCIHCGYTCIQSIQLKTHFKRKHPGMHDEYTCVVCRYSTVSRRNWLGHQRKCVGNNHVNESSAATAAKV